MSKLRVNFYISDDTYAKVKESAEKLGVSVSGFINVCISDRLKQDSVTDMASLLSLLNSKALQVENKVEDKVEIES